MYSQPMLVSGVFMMQLEVGGDPEIERAEKEFMRACGCANLPFDHRPYGIERTVELRRRLRVIMAMRAHAYGLPEDLSLVESTLAFVCAVMARWGRAIRNDALWDEKLAILNTYLPDPELAPTPRKLSRRYIDLLSAKLDRAYADLGMTPPSRCNPGRKPLADILADLRLFRALSRGLFARGRL